MVDPTPRSVKSVKSRLDTIKQGDEAQHSVSKVQSHFLVPSDKLDKITRRVIAPYAEIERKDVKEEVREGPYLDINRFNVFLEDTVDLNSLLYETANVLKAVTNSSGVFVYIVDPIKNEVVLMTQNTKNPERHEVNIPIEEGKIASAHVAFTKEYLVIEDVQRDRRFAEGLKWVDAKVALCMPVLKPDGDCYAVLELFRTHCEPYDHNIIYTVVSVACWSGAAVHQAQARITLQKTAHLNSELRTLLHNYFCDLASIDTMLTDMLAVIKSFIGAMRSSFFIIDREHIGEHLQADMWDDGWSSENTTMPRRKMKVNLSQEQTPAGLVARTGQVLNLRDVYRDPRFTKEIDPTTGTVVRTSLVAPIMDKNGVIGVVQLTNKTNAHPFDTDDEMIFSVFVNYCSLIVHFYNMQTKKIYHENLNKVYSNLMGLHLLPCRHDLEELMETNGVVLPPPNFKNYNYHISEGSKEDMPGLVCSMFVETFADRNFERQNLADFVLTVLLSYRDNPYHNAEHAFVFTHTMYLMLVNNTGYFDFVEVRAQITPLLTDCAFDWTNNSHRRMLKGILMTTSDLSGSCKPFGVAKAISEAVYEEFYNQGDKERALGYTPLSMMDRRRYLNQPPEQIQFLSVVVIPCLMIVQTVFPNTGPLLENCRKTQEAWHEEIAIRGQKLWRQSVSVPRASRNLFNANTDTATN
ncbi:cAMP and cAMP-inhibited cGMP 3',5'-cyclic phosphodiesterase 10A-like isoform X7 [Pieris napi]|uniref:cAMP and cAMP-inhibited cGMP 3',5'-cyclic phosphodiesterase 10A-like isoform X7 n=1 Tax=Pieris napi TaxID=78633 RepID=UPI001FB9354A|nr:cAMP and cAMP-inhibited cGMP 3',5'-cyclic phosphodiesterase 10A-like isoform X7 [Pieris napi]